MINEGIVIAIDGFSACGKSTLAKALAKKLGYTYIDTGAMYRAVTLYFMNNQIDWSNTEQVDRALKAINISFKKNHDSSITILNGEVVEDAIRKMNVSNHVSPVAELSAVRRFLVKQQQQMGGNKRVVMDGRDIGTVVFPKAKLKLFLTATAEERTRRRFEELKAKGDIVSFEAVKENLSRRDRIDSTREDSPLKQADDAVIIDSTLLTEDEQLAMVLALAKMRGA